jgi:hypothetical protein
MPTQGEEGKLYCANPECQAEIVGSGVIVTDPTRAIDWEARGIPQVIHSQLEDGTPNQALILHQVCFMLLFDAIARGEHTVILEIAAGPIGEIKIGMGLIEED